MLILQFIFVPIALELFSFNLKCSVQSDKYLQSKMQNIITGLPANCKYINILSIVVVTGNRLCHKPNRQQLRSTPCKDGMKSSSFIDNHSHSLVH